MRKEIIEKILEEWNVCSCDNSALADRLLEEFSPEGEYIKKADILNEMGDTNMDILTDEVKEIVNSLPSYSFPNSENKGEWVSVVDSYHEDGTPFESHWECSKCGSDRSGWGKFKFCPDCGADMREELNEALDMAISALSESKGDLISRGEVESVLHNNLHALIDTDQLYQLYKDINRLPAYSFNDSAESKGFEGMTNGEVMQAVYVDSEIEIDEAWKTVTVYLGADGDYCEDEVKFDLDWWNAPYKAESEEA